MDRKKKLFLFLPTEVNSQRIPQERERLHRRNRPPPAAPPAAPPAPAAPAAPALVPLPIGLQLMRPDGTFYDLVPPVNPVTTPNRYHIGIMEPNGYLRPFYFNRIAVKVKRLGPGHYDIVPLSREEFIEYRFNQDLTLHNDRIAAFVANQRNRHARDGD